jgi:hypothetical protein
MNIRRAVMKMGKQAKKMSKAERANLVQGIADCRKVLDTSVDADELFYARNGMREMQAELLARG